MARKKTPATPADNLYQQFLDLNDDDRQSFWKLLGAHLDDSPQIKALVENLTFAKHPLLLPQFTEFFRESGTPLGDAIARLLQKLLECDRGWKDAHKEYKAKAKALKKRNPNKLPPELVERIIRMKKDDGRSCQFIANRLNSEPIMNANGCPWKAAAIDKIIKRHE